MHVFAIAASKIAITELQQEENGALRSETEVRAEAVAVAEAQRALRLELLQVWAWSLLSANAAG